MDSTITHNHFQLKKNIPDLRAGDKVKVHQKIQESGKTRIQVFEGLVIKTQHGRGINGTFTVRRISLGVGVEKTFPLHMPAIVKIEKLKSAKVRRAKLYYVRGLIGKKAKRLKREKESKEVWEDVIVEEDKGKEEKTEAQEQEAEDQPTADQPRARKTEEDKKESGSKEADLEKPEKVKADQNIEDNSLSDKIPTESVGKTKKEPKDSKK